MNKVEQYKLIICPVGYHFKLEIDFFENVNIYILGQSLVLKRPQNILYYFDDILAFRLFDFKLILAYFHSLNLASIIKP